VRVAETTAGNLHHKTRAALGDLRATGDARVFVARHNDRLAGIATVAHRFVGASRRCLVVTIRWASYMARFTLERVIRTRLAHLHRRIVFLYHGPVN